MDNSSQASVQQTWISGEVFLDAPGENQGSYRLFQVEPVTFDGFVPVTLSKGLRGIEVGQNLTLLSRGPIEGLTSHSGAFEGILQVTGVEDKSSWFLAGYREHVPCKSSMSNGFDSCADGSTNAQLVSLFAGDGVAPLLDSDNNLVALMSDCCTS